MESLSTNPSPPGMMEVEPMGSLEENIIKATVKSPRLQHQIKQLRPLLNASSRLGRALAELFGLLVKLCVGSSLRHRRVAGAAPPAPPMPTPAARAVASSLTSLLSDSLKWIPPPSSPIPKFR